MADNPQRFGAQLDPDELAILEAARIVKTGRSPLIQFVIAADGTTTGFRVSAVDDPDHGRFFACAPMALPQSMRELLGTAMEQAARRRGGGR
jgi:hypothetical protein